MRRLPIPPAGWGHPARHCYKPNHHPVGAGHAPPATVCYNEHNGSSVGAAYMPPVATIRILRTIGKAARDAYMRPLQPAGNLHFPPLYLTSRLFVGRGLDPSLLFFGNRQISRRGGVTPPYGAIPNHHPVGAGHAPPAVLRQ